MVSTDPKNISHPNNLASLNNLDNFTPGWVDGCAKVVGGGAMYGICPKLEFERTKNSCTPSMP